MVKRKTKSKGKTTKRKTTKRKTTKRKTTRKFKETDYATLRLKRKIKASPITPTQQIKGKYFLTHHKYPKSEKSKKYPDDAHLVKQYKRDCEKIVPRHWRSNPKRRR